MPLVLNKIWLLILGYDSPNSMRTILQEALGTETRFQNTLDLGCGTGLSGQAFKPICHRLSGVDLSPKMLKLAKEKNIYDVLKNDNINQFLDNTNEHYDLFIAADVLIYVGDLESIFTKIRNCANKQAYFIFTTEHTDKSDYHLQTSDRFAHSCDYVTRMASMYNFEIITESPTNLRRDRGNQWISGHIYLLQC